MPDAYDAILIGAGHNTLAAALHLASRGWRVALFEQAQTAGGAVKTGEYTAPGFRHDWGAMNLSLFAGSAFFRMHGAELVAQGLEFVRAEHPFASVFPDGSWLGVSADRATTTARIARLSPEDAATWNRLLDAFPAEAAHLFALLGAPMTLRAMAGIGLRAWRAKGVPGMAEMGRFLLASPRAWLTQTFRDDRMRAMLAVWGMHLDFAPDIAGGAVFPYLEAMASQSFGMVIGKGGADTIIRALTLAINARGGAVICNAPVLRILHSGGRATGVELADGQQIAARRAVIAGVAPGALNRLTGRDDPGLAGFAHAPGTMMIHLALSGLPDWRAGPEVQRFAYVHIAPSMDQMARTYAQAQAGQLPDAPVIVVGQPTAVDPSRAPLGCHVLWLQVRMVPGTIIGDAGGTIAATDWACAAQPFADRALNMLEQYAPGTRAKILGQRVVSPLDLQAENPNLVGGDQLCGSHHLSQHFMFRPGTGRANGATGIRNLHLTGAAVWPGAGTGAGAGYLLARKLAGT